MTLRSLQILILALVCLAGWIVSEVPLILRPAAAAQCVAPADDMARRACADLSRGR